MTGSAPATARRADAPVRGALLVCVAALSFVGMNTIVKYLTQSYSVPEVIWGRYFFHLVLILLLFPHRIPTLLVSKRKGLQVLRSLLVLLATLSMFTAVSYMPLAEAVATSYVSPLILTGLSAVILHEHVGPRRWTAVAIGFVGVLVILRPGVGVTQWAALLPLSMALFYALYNVTTRAVADSAPPLTSLFYTALVGAVTISAVVPFFWTWPTPAAWGLLVLTGLFGGIGHFALIVAFERAEASMVAPFAYTELIWATLSGVLVFGDFPDAWTFVGAGIIAASGLYVWHRERHATPRPETCLPSGS